MIKFCLLLCMLAIAVNGATVQIVGGHDAPNHKYPYQVSFRERTNGRNEKHFCSGSILNRKWIVTAAHCFQNRNTRDVVAVAATNYLSERGERYRIESYIIHEAYTDFYHNDICLVHLRDEIRFNNIIYPIKVPVGDLPSGNLGAVFSGWGSTEYGGPLSNNLQEINLQIISNEKCRRIWPIDDKHVCTLNGAGQGVCIGDGGGPLVFKRHLIGISSYVHACANGYPDVFTKVWPFVEWIRDKMGTNESP